MDESAAGIILKAFVGAKKELQIFIVFVFTAGVIW